MTGYIHLGPTVLASFAASLVEFVEALTVILAVAIVIVGRGFYHVALERRAEGVQAAYGAAATDARSSQIGT